MFKDFGGMAEDGATEKGGGKRMRRTSPDGEQRTWLRVYETLPAQMLNAYGIGRYSQLTDQAVWEHLTKPLKTGAAYMTEYASKDGERRGIAINRWLLSVLNFCQYQKQSTTQMQNESILKDKMCKEVYAEIDKILPALVYCLAPKKAGVKSGASALRASAMVSEPGAQTGAEKTPEALEEHSKAL
jgi:hypothetical protein